MIKDLAYWKLIQLVKDKKVLLHEPYGNIGDVLLQDATKQLFSRYHVEYKVCTPDAIPETTDAQILVYGAGGNVSGRYQTEKTVEQLSNLTKKVGIPFVCFPQSIEHWKPHLLLFDHLFLRDQVSVNLACHHGTFAELVPDVGLAYSPNFPIPVATQGTGYFTRSDGEKRQPRGDGYNDPASHCHTVRAYIEHAARYKKIVTDRLHFAISGILAKREVVLCRNDYHKNESIWNSYLHLFCQFQKDI